MKYRIICIVLLFAAVFMITLTSGAVILMAPVTLNPGSSGTTSLTLDTAPTGISGYQMKVSSDNPTVVSITNVTFPQWASLSEAVPGEAGVYALRAIDLNSGVEAGASSITLATLSLQASGEGNAKITIQNLIIDDDAGSQVQAESTQGSITVGSGDTTPTPAPTSGPAPRDIQINLKPGWNLINIPVLPSPGFETAEIFKNVQSGGHSMLTYDKTGWVTIGKEHILSPMTGYWVYTTTPVMIPLKIQEGVIESKSLAPGWNLAGITGTTERAPESALSGLSTWTYLVTFDSSSQQYRDATMKDAQSQSVLNPFEGFWIYVDSPGTISPVA